MKSYDLIVIGIGGMGSAVVAHAASRRIRVLGIEQHSLPNRRGSSHGMTRILRVGLHEGPTYVPLVLRAVELWVDLGKRIGAPIFHNNGSFDVATPDSPIFRGSRSACEAHNLAHEILDARETHRRFPGITPDPEMLAVYQPASGFVLSELAITAHINLALAAGGELHGHETVISWDKRGDTYTIVTDRGAYEAGAVVVSTGAWAGKMLAQFNIPIKPERQVVGWFQPKHNPELFFPARMPSWIIDSRSLGHFYGLPIHGIPGFKLSKFSYGDVVEPRGSILEPQPHEEEVMRIFLRKYFPKADGPVMTLGATFFESTPDRDFVVDRLPGHENLWLAVGFSGHGYKYCSAIGEVMVDLVTKGASAFDLSPFRATRFQSNLPRPNAK
jgi:sarcosine oxidase